MFSILTDNEHGGGAPLRKRLHNVAIFSISVHCYALLN